MGRLALAVHGLAPDSKFEVVSIEEGLNGMSPIADLQALGIDPMHFGKLRFSSKNKNPIHARAMEIVPLWNNLGLSYIASGSMQKARACFERALASLSGLDSAMEENSVWIAMHFQGGSVESVVRANFARVVTV